MWGKFIWLMSAALIAYLVGTSPWTKNQAHRIWRQFLRISDRPWRMIERIYRRIDSNLIGRIFLATLGLLLVILFVFWVTHIKFDLFNDASLKVTGWDDLRTLGWALSGAVATWLAIVGAILSAARTKAMADTARAMEETNRQKTDEHRQRLYIDALETLNRKKDYQKAGAIEALRKLGLQKDGEYRIHAIEILATFIRSTARIQNKETNRRENSDDTSLNLASALHALSDLQKQMDVSHSPLGEDFLIFEDLDLSHLRFNKGRTLSRIHFRKCSFFKCHFLGVKFQDTNFWDCNFDESVLSYAHFMPG